MEPKQSSNQPRHSTPVKKYGNVPYNDLQNGHNSSGTSSGILSLNDLESTTVEKQRKELQLLIAELKDRDRELNDMVAAHQHQLAAWERDRQRALALEKKNEQYEGELKKRHEQLRLLIQRLKISESKHKSKNNALETSQVRMKQLEKDINSTSFEVQDLKEKNTSLNSSISEITSKVTRLETREQELMALLRSKERELVDVSDHVSSLTSKVRCLDAELQDSRRNEGRCRAELQDERAKNKHCRTELDGMKAEMIEKTNEMLSYRRDIAKLKDEIHRLQKEIHLRDEEVRRKDELIELQRSKQERSDRELAMLRQIYESQQKELAALHLSLSDSHELLDKQDGRLNEMRLGKSYNGNDALTASEESSFDEEEQQAITKTGRNVKLSSLCPSVPHEIINDRFEKESTGQVFKVSPRPRGEFSSEEKIVNAGPCGAGRSDVRKEAGRECYPQLHSRVPDDSLAAGFEMNGLLDDVDDCCSDTTNDLLEEARRSTTPADGFLDVDAPPIRSKTPDMFHSSPTSKLQRLLAESREMVHNLERAALTPVPRPSSARTPRDRY